MLFYCCHVTHRLHWCSMCSTTTLSMLILSTHWISKNVTDFCANQCGHQFSTFIHGESLRVKGKMFFVAFPVCRAFAHDYSLSYKHHTWSDYQNRKILQTSTSLDTSDGGIPVKRTLGPSASGASDELAVLQLRKRRQWILKTNGPCLSSPQPLFQGQFCVKSLLWIGVFIHCDIRITITKKLHLHFEIKTKGNSEMVHYDCVHETQFF